MTIINNTHKFIYLHVPKTAGTSIATLLSPLTALFDLEIGATDFGEKIQGAYHEKFQVAKHSTLNDIHNVMDENLFKSYFKFSFVRNPFDRVFSAYNFFRVWASPDRNFNNLIRSFDSFSQFINSNCLTDVLVPDNILFPQTHWLCSESNGIAMDFIGKVEEMAEGLEIISDKIKVKELINKQQLQILNGSILELERILLNSKTIEKIINIYEFDFKQFKYDLSPNHSKYFSAH
jgi:hypothetical protein